MVINLLRKKYLFIIPIIYLVIFVIVRLLHYEFFDSFFIDGFFEFFERFFLNPYMILVFTLIILPKKMIKNLSYQSIIVIGIISLLILCIQWLFWPFFWHHNFLEEGLKGIFISRVSFSFMAGLLIIQYLFLSFFKKYSIHKWVIILILCLPALLIFWLPALLSVLFMFAA